MIRKSKGWKGESSRHSLAAKKVRTGSSLVEKMFRAPWKIHDYYQTKSKKKLSDIKGIDVIVEESVNPFSVADEGTVMEEVKRK